MTGYGVGKVKKEGIECLIEIKTLNNKYCEINIKNSYTSSEIDQNIEKLIKNRIYRGKVNILIKIDNYYPEEEKIILNENIANSYYEMLKKLKEKYNLKDEISLDYIIKFKDIFQMVKVENAINIWPLIEETLKIALDSLLKMREKEGRVLVGDIRKRVNKIRKGIDKIEKILKLHLKDYKNNFLNKLKELTKDLNVDEGRIELEAAIFAEKSDITEEIIRTKSHLIQFNDLLNSKDSEGRKMDFLIQEINREINTIGSKNNNLEITSLVILAKSELEKIREQARNIDL
jgi:uncharacterized protein (TIGR00255 family)